MSDDDYVGPDALNGGEDWREQMCECGHSRGVHGGHDGLARCALRRCPTICGQFRRKRKSTPGAR